MDDNIKCYNKDKNEVRYLKSVVVTSGNAALQGYFPMPEVGYLEDSNPNTPKNDTGLPINIEIKNPFVPQQIKQRGRPKSK